LCGCHSAIFRRSFPKDKFGKSRQQGMNTMDKNVETETEPELQSVLVQSSRLGTVDESPPESKNEKLNSVRRRQHTPATQAKASSPPAMCNEPKRSVSLTSSAEGPAPTIPRCKPKRNISAPPVLQPPPSALKTKPRIPLELQAVFLESNRNGIVDKPAPKAASRIFGKVFAPKKKNASFAPTEYSSDGEFGNFNDDCEGQSSSKKCASRRRLLNFGANETFVFEKSKPTKERYPTSEKFAVPLLNRWNSGLHKNEASSSAMPLRMPRRLSPAPRQ